MDKEYTSNILILYIGPHFISHSNLKSSSNSKKNSSFSLASSNVNMFFIITILSPSPC